MPTNGLITPRPPGPSIPAGTSAPPWLQPNVGPVRVARTYVAARGADLLRAADAEQRTSPFVDAPYTSPPQR